MSVAGSTTGMTTVGDPACLLDDEGFDDLVYRLTGEAMADDWPERDRQTFPDLDGIPPGPFLAVILAAVDRFRLNGYDLVRLLRARHRLVSHLQAGMMADSVEIAHTATGTSESGVDRTEQQFAFASDEIRAALTLTRYSAEQLLSLATDVCARPILRRQPIG